MINFPKHHSLFLIHNEHKNYYETVEQYVDYRDNEDFWVNDHQKQKSLETQELWELQWYPKTPVGFYKLMGADLDVVLQAALDLEASPDYGYTFE